MKPEAGIEESIKVSSTCSHQYFTASLIGSNEKSSNFEFLNKGWAF